MKTHRGLLNWGIFLVGLGAVPLAVQLNVVSPDAAQGLLRLWPLILIGIGLGLVLRFSRAQALGGVIVAATFGILIGTFFVAGPRSFSAACTGDQPNGTPITRNGTASGTLDLSVELTCGEMTVTRAGSGSWSVVAQTGDENPTIEPNGASLRLRSVTLARWPFGNDQREDWQVVLPTDVTLGSTFLTVNAAQLKATLGSGPIGSVSATYNASDGWLDLAGAPSGSLNATLNASTIGLILPAGPFSADITINASSLNLCAAPDLGLHITFDDTLSSNNFAAAGLVQSGKTWQSANYATAQTRDELHISANVSSATLNPQGGCQ
jgi:hypothetical protein